ncbi:hypothetical protein [Dyella silvatica]|uniref:hypothetical protein n=1 Tax=Dyella silvatica TaxID=2992128 RepID=UPI0022589389|nr:hypothetical protein [Dyella silvatica]
MPAALALSAFIAFAAVYIDVSLAGNGCWGGGFLLLLGAAVFCLPGSILLLVAMWQRPQWIPGLLAALVFLALLTQLISSLVGGPSACGTG